jgi:hypothetical protein
VTQIPRGASGPDPPADIADVIRRLRTIEASEPASDGVVCSARFYREVTDTTHLNLRTGKILRR